MQETYTFQSPRLPTPIHIPYFERNGPAGNVARWVAFAIVLVSVIAFIGLGTRVTRKNRVYHYISATIAAIATLSYYAMATGYGAVLIFKGLKYIQGREVATFRPAYYARYVDAALTTPMILFELGLISGMSWVDIGSIVIANEGWVFTQLFAALTRRGAVMWGWYIFSCVFLIYIVWTLLSTGAKSSRLQADRVYPVYMAFAIVTGAVWIAYTVAFAISNGTNVVNPDIEIIIYVVLDMIIKSALGFGFIFAHSRGDDDHAGIIPAHLIEPRSNGRIHLPISHE